MPKFKNFINNRDSFRRVKNLKIGNHILMGVDDNIPVEIVDIKSHPTQSSLNITVKELSSGETGTLMNIDPQRLFRLSPKEKSQI